MRHLLRRPGLVLAAAAAVAALISPAGGKPGQEAARAKLDFAAFFAACEKGDLGAALAALPAALRDASLYDARTAAGPR